MDIIEKARAYAADKHADKKRKYIDQPYFNHLQAVTLQGVGVMEPPILAAAYLHNCIGARARRHDDMRIRLSRLPSWALLCVHRRRWGRMTREEAFRTFAAIGNACAQRGTNSGVSVATPKAIAD